MTTSKKILQIAKRKIESGERQAYILKIQMIVKISKYQTLTLKKRLLMIIRIKKVTIKKVMMMMKIKIKMMMVVKVKKKRKKEEIWMIIILD